MLWKPLRVKSYKIIHHIDSSIKTVAYNHAEWNVSHNNKRLNVLPINGQVNVIHYIKNF